MRAQHHILGDVEGILHFTGGMVLRDVEGFEVVVVQLDFRALDRLKPSQLKMRVISTAIWVIGCSLPRRGNLPERLYRSLPVSPMPVRGFFRELRKDRLQPGFGFIEQPSGSRRSCSGTFPSSLKSCASSPFLPKNRTRPLRGPSVLSQTGHLAGSRLDEVLNSLFHVLRGFFRFFASSAKASGLVAARLAKALRSSVMLAFCRPFMNLE